MGIYEDERIADLAREAGRCAREKRRHLKARNDTLCEREEEWFAALPDDPLAEADEPRPTPCWQLVTEYVPGCYGEETKTVPYGGDLEEWCEKCRKRQYHHDLLTHWSKATGIARMRLTRALDREAAHFEGRLP